MTQWLYKYDIGQQFDLGPDLFFPRGALFNPRSRPSKGAFRFLRVGNQLWKLELGYMWRTHFAVFDFTNMNWVDIGYDRNDSFDFHFKETLYYTSSEMIYMIQKHRVFTLWKFDTKVHILEIELEFKLQPLHKLESFIRFENKWYMITKSEFNVASLEWYNSEERQVQSLLSFEEKFQPLKCFLFKHCGMLHLLVQTNNRDIQIYRLKNDISIELIRNFHSDRHIITDNFWISDNCLYINCASVSLFKAEDVIFFDFNSKQWKQGAMKENEGMRHQNNIVYIEKNLMITLGNKNFHMFIGVSEQTLESTILLQIAESYIERWKKGENIDSLRKEIDQLPGAEYLKRKIRDATIWRLQDVAEKRPPSCPVAPCLPYRI